MSEKEYRCKAEVEASYEAPPPEPPKVPVTFREKWDNFWYYYKGRTLLIAFLVLVFGITGWQFFTRENPDYIVMLAMDKTVPADVTEALEDYLDDFGEDLNGDGKVAVQIYDVSSSNNTEIRQANATKMIAELQNGEVMLFVVDSVYFDKLNGMQVFEQRDEFPDRDGYGYNLRDTRLADALNAAYPNFISHDVYLAKRVVAGTSFEKLEKSVRSEKESLALMEKLLASLE